MIEAIFFVIMVKINTENELIHILAIRQNLIHMLLIEIMQQS